MLTRLLTLGFALAAGFVIGAWATDADDVRVPVPGDVKPAVPPSGIASPAADRRDAADTADVEAIIETIYATLDLEVRERQRLEADVEALSEQVAALRNRLGDTDPAPRGSDLRRAAVRRGAVTEERLVEAGFNAAEAGMIKRRLDEIEMDQLYLRDTARREGWLGSARYRDEIRAINERREGLREELGDTGWDRYLYAQGRPNRVTVDSVLTESPAFGAGIQVGDVIVNYDGQRVFTQSDIRTATASGQAGSMVAVEILRDGNRQQVYLPRGPMGVRLGSTVAKP